MCTEEGGLGITNLEVMNDAMVLNQLWRTKQGICGMNGSKNTGPTTGDVGNSS